MTAQNLTSVIMVTYHTGPVLESAIEAVLAQTAEVELILVNNGQSPDVEQQLIQRFKDDPAVRLMTGHGNIGLARAANLGVRVASGQHILLLNPRCVLEPDTLMRLLETASQAKTSPYILAARLVDPAGQELEGSRSAMLSPATALVDTLYLSRFFPKARLSFHKDPVPATISPVPAVSGAFMFMKKSTFVQARGFLECYVTYAADMDFCFRFTQHGGTLLFVPQIKVTMVAKEPLAKGASLEEEKLSGAIRFFHENYSDKYVQPLLWGIYGLLWLKAKLKGLLAR